MPQAELPSAPQDPVSLLAQRVESGGLELSFDKHYGYLRSLLKALHVPSSSQVLAFSKTSTQAHWTTPRTPRAIYFCENVSVGWVPGADVIDLAGVDPQFGSVFYTVAQQPGQRPIFTRRNDCLECHQNRKTLDVPGWMVRSVYTGTDGTPLSSVDGFVSGHNSPLEVRWGGWYVTGSVSGGSHLGNRFAPAPGHPERLTPELQLPNGRKLFDSAQYLSPHSDIVALLVFEHQVRMQALLTLANQEANEALKLAGCPTNKAADDLFQQRVTNAGEMLLSYMLFRDEAALPGPVHGSSSFAAQFQRAGPRDSKGRSLRQFDLHSRLFRYPCSFLIYSDSFDELPVEMKRYLYRRLHQVLAGRNAAPPYSTLTDSDRKNVFEILLETKPEFREFFTTAKITRSH